MDRLHVGSRKREFVICQQMLVVHLSHSLVILLFSVFLFILMATSMNVDSEGGNPSSAASASVPAILGAKNGIPGVTAAVPHVPGIVATVDGNPGAVQIPGFQSGAQVAISGFQAQGGQQGMQLFGMQADERNAVSQVMSPNAGFSSSSSFNQVPQGAPELPEQQRPAQATQERLRGVIKDGTPWEAQRVNIVWQNTSVSDQFRGEVLRLNEMMTATRSTHLDREQRLRIL